MKKFVGILLILLGIFALVTPFTPGALLILTLGVQLLGFKVFFLNKKEAEIKNKMPM